MGERWALPSAPAFLHRAARAGIAVVLGSLLLACHPFDSEGFALTNATNESVSVRWERDAKAFATFAPQEGMEIAVTESRCDRPIPGDKLIAWSAGGRTYTYGPPICRGELWRIGG